MIVSFRTFDPHRSGDERPAAAASRDKRHAAHRERHNIDTHTRYREIDGTRARERPDEASMRARGGMRHARTPLRCSRRTPAKLVGGGKGDTHCIAPLEGKERSSSRGPEDSNMPLLSAPPLSLSLCSRLPVAIDAATTRSRLLPCFSARTPRSLSHTFPCRSFSFSSAFICLRTPGTPL